jgi:hypothetical protein
MSDLLDKYLQELEQIEEAGGKKTSFAKITRQTKIDRAIGSLATKLAKELNDPWYNKMIKFREKYFSMRNKIRTKYAPKVRARAVSGKGVSDIVQQIKKNKQN